MRCSYPADSSSSYQQMGAAFMTQGNLDEAIAAYRKAIKLNPDCSATHNNLGDALAKTSKVDEASQAYRRAIELEVKNL
ncbi:tetratricopeptide repeat protein [Tychonema sp. LEGE 07203]|uniref:tetratricopeptide repeat protein n=1 Tax=Tychonema sp. LEGE 07203 TaxID=1828671 RepID=UPI00187E3735|nr:tetratricopeptide repeat protein [Tychonema sp. LEGE 07203]MBE9095731.1 tetratricopeptide repeat protein [Tychonema sp. LEGE 07203]